MLNSFEHFIWLGVIAFIVRSLSSLQLFFSSSPFFKELGTQRKLINIIPCFEANLRRDFGSAY